MLKKAHGREIEHLTRCSITHVSKTEFFFSPIFHAAFQATMTEINTKAASRGAGLVPFDTESVVQKLDLQLQTPTPVEEETVPSTPWGSKSPMAVLEAEFQSEYLERQIRRHHSSYPESISEALKSFSKGTTAVMNELALIGAEVQDL